MNVKIDYIPKIFDFFESNDGASIFVIAGGRGKGATWAIGNELIIKSFERKHFILCTREIKASVDHSSRRTIERLITRAGLKDYFIFQKYATINRKTGSEFIYSGLSKVTEENVQGIEGISLAWLGEAHTMEMSTWQKFEPTVREEGAVIYIDYNIRHSVTPIHSLFTDNASANGYPFKGKKNVKGLAYLFLTYLDNTLIPNKLLEVADRNKEQYSDADFDWVWLGKLKDASERYICSEEAMEDAMNRTLELSPYGETYVGIDVAHLGGDEIPMYKRRGNKIIDFAVYEKKRSYETTDLIKEFCEYKKDTIINIDNGYIGAAIADDLEREGYIVNRVNFGGTDLIYFDVDHSKDNVTDMAFNMVSLLPLMDIPKDPILKNQTIQRRWDFVNEQGVRKIEKKEDFKEHAMHLDGHTSPDRFDALILCCYEPEGQGMVLLGDVI